MMRLATALAATGVVSLILLEILKFLLEPIKLWLLGVFAIALKLALIGLGLAVALAVGAFFLIRARRAKTAAAE